MGAFDGSIKVARAVADPLTDHKLPSSKSLAWGEITSPTAVSGTTGDHCELVHGDKFRQVTGNVVENIQQNFTGTVTGNHTLTVMGNQTHDVMGNHDHSVVGNHSQSVMGNQNLSVLGNAMDTHVGPCTKTYVDNKIESYSKHRFTSMAGNSDFTYMNAQYAGFGFQLQVFIYQIQIFGVYITIVTVPGIAAAMAGIGDENVSPSDIASGASDTMTAGAFASGMPLVNPSPSGMSITLNSGLNMSLDVAHIESSLFKSEADSLKAQFQAVAGKIWAAIGGVGAAEAKVAGRVSAPPEPLTGLS